MKKIGIITLNGYFNYGNRLQNYALTKILEKHGFDVYTIWNKNIKNVVKDNIKKEIFFIKKYKRFSNFYRFSKKNMKEILLKNVLSNSFDYLIIGSDQVWNPSEITNNINLLGLEDLEIPTLSYSASFGVESVPQNLSKTYKEKLLKLKSVSVRENNGKELIEKLTGRKDIEVLIDPTMLLSSEEWSKIIKKPKKFDEKKYILNYFLGELSNDRKKQIKKLADENNCSIINITDVDDKYYVSGLEEFLFLIKNAFLICTDSFHASVFSFLFDKSFVAFDRDDKIMGNMNSRIDTLLKKFHINDRKYNGKKITDANILHNYNESYKILNQEIDKSEKFLRKNLK